MRLTIKTTVALLVGFSVLLIAFGFHELDRQERQATKQLREAQRTLGYLFRPGIARTWRLEGRAAAAYVVEYTEQTLLASKDESAFQLRWVWLDTEGDDPSAPLVGPGKLTPGVIQTTIESNGDGDRMITYVPLDSGIDGERPAALEIVGSLAVITEESALARRRLLVTAGIGAAAFCVLSVLIGVWFVGRPVHKLVSATERIGQGDLDSRVGMKQRDELGRIGRSIDAMADGLARARERAEEESKARLRALEQMRHADRLATVGKLASGIAHELGTPLSVVAGRARLIGNGTVQGDEALQYAESIEAQANKMARIIRQLLDFARRRAVTLTPKDVRTLVEQTVELLETVATKHGVALRVEGGDDALSAPVDGVQLQQVLTNLIVNAIHASSKGDEVAVSFDQANCAPPAGADARPGEYLRISVSDQGKGMSAETLQRVFEPFFTTKDVGEGTGLGLSVSHGIVEGHGGWISVDSTLGEGSRFVVHLPIRPQELS